MTSSAAARLRDYAYRLETMRADRPKELPPGIQQAAPGIYFDLHRAVDQVKVVEKKLPNLLERAYELRAISQQICCIGRRGLKLQLPQMANIVSNAHKLSTRLSTLIEELEGA